MIKETLQSRVVRHAGYESSEAVRRGRQDRLNERASAFRWLQLAAVLEVERNEEGRWTGFLTTQLLNMEGTREKVKMTLSAVGNGVFAGGPPEVGAILVLGSVPGGRPVVLAQVPMDIESLFQIKALPDMVEGEYLIRAGNATDDGKVGGGSVMWDRDGRVIVQDREQRLEVTVGPSFDLNGNVETNPKTGEEIRLRIRAFDANDATTFNLRVDDGGNLLIEAERIDLLADRVNVGDDPDDNNQLVTRAWVKAVFDTHMHPTAGTGSPSPPTPQAETGYTEFLRSK